MTIALTSRLLASVAPRLLWRCAFGAGLGSVLAIRAFERRRRRGEPYFPAFLFVSLTNRCDLRCRGCWVTPTPPTDMEPARFDRIVSAARAKGCRFFGLLGGEPLLYGPLASVIERHRDCYFQVFTNGQALDDATARTWRRLGNVTPLVSIEGGPSSHADRRGSARSYERALEALACCRRHRLFFGVATSVCRSSWSDVVSEAFLADMVCRGAHYVWYYVYRPAGPDPAPSECLDGPAIESLRAFLVAQRRRQPLLIVDAYWDHLGRALCPAATGISVHVNALGDVEPCPPVQFADARLGEGEDAAAMAGSSFLAAFRAEVPRLTRGCVLLERPADLARLAASGATRDTSGRDGRAELAARSPLPGHATVQPMPETSWSYRLAKRYWFFGFGAYG
jgi:MoaA/NifB/PqqE/SkfB family radical SAM enzyme